MKVKNLKHPFILQVIVAIFGDFWRFKKKQGISDRIGYDVNP